MENSDDGIQLPKVIKYLPELGPTPEPLRISNSSTNTYVFKIRTNQRSAISLHSTHGFLDPSTTLQISIKILQKPNPSIPLKLQVNYAHATAEDIESNDSKKAITSKQNLHKRVIILRSEKKHHSEAHQNAKAVDGSFDRNGSHEDEAPLDSSVKKEDSEHGFNTVEVVPFIPASHATITPTIIYTRQEAEQQKDEKVLENMFVRTFSVEKPIDDVNTFSHINEEQGVKMNIFGSVLAEGHNESPTIEQPSLKEQWPFKGRREEVIEQAKRKGQIERGPLVESMIIGEEQDYQRQIQALNIRVQYYREFIRDIKGLPIKRPEKKYPKWLLIVIFIVFFFLGGATKHLFM